MGDNPLDMTMDRTKVGALVNEIQRFITDNA